MDCSAGDYKTTIATIAGIRTTETNIKFIWWNVQTVINNDLFIFSNFPNISQTRMKTWQLKRFRGLKHKDLGVIIISLKINGTTKMPRFERSLYNNNREVELTGHKLSLAQVPQSKPVTVQCPARSMYFKLHQYLPITGHQCLQL